MRRLWVATLLLAGCLDHQALQRHRQAYVRAHDCVATWHGIGSVKAKGYTLFECGKQEILVEDVDGKPWGP